MTDIPRFRFATFEAHGRLRYGLATDRGMIEIADHDLTTLDAAVVAGALPKLGDRAQGRAVDFAPGEFRYAPPLARPEKIICVGVNFPDRNEEYKDGQAAPGNPSLFIRFPRSFVGHEQPLVRPRASHQLDYEGEIAIVIGKAGRHVAETDALAHISALTLCNEGTLRDWVRHAKFNVTQGKNFDASGAMGPWLVPFEHEDQIGDIGLTTHVNGQLRQQDRTSRMIYGFRTLIAYITTFTTLVPGDIVVTGTPTGAGARLDPPKWLAPGDVIEVAADGIGTLRNGVVDEVS